MATYDTGLSWSIPEPGFPCATLRRWMGRSAAWDDLLHDRRVDHDCYVQFGWSILSTLQQFICTSIPCAHALEHDLNIQTSRTCTIALATPASSRLELISAKG